MPNASHSRSGAAGFVLLGLASLVFFLTQFGKHRFQWWRATPTYRLTATFDNVGELRAGARVSMSGVEIGRVLRIDLDNVRHQAIVLMDINAGFTHISTDSDASINTEGILGAKYIRLTNGSADTYVHEDSQLSNTRSATSIEALVRHLLLIQKTPHDRG